MLEIASSRGGAKGAASLSTSNEKRFAPTLSGKRELAIGRESERSVYILVYEEK